MDKMDNIGQAMPKVFALFTAGAMASLALPGMSGFASELSVFIGFSNSDIYSSTFRTVTVFLAAVGLILTPIYLLSMLREVFFNSDIVPLCGISDAGVSNKQNEGAVCFGTNCVLPADAEFKDASAREIFVAMCFFIMIIGMGVYPKLATQIYDVKTVALNTQMRQTYTEVAQTKNLQSEVASVFNISKYSN
jgi:NAD(P)H-quinone oxidoreductase subunit 4